MSRDSAIAATVVLGIVLGLIGIGYFAATKFKEERRAEQKRQQLPSIKDPIETTTASHKVSMYANIRNEWVFVVICPQNKNPTSQQIAGGMCDEKTPALQSRRYRMEDQHRVKP